MAHLFFSSESRINLKVGKKVGLEAYLVKTNQEFYQQKSPVASVCDNQTVNPA